jgi:hypothetical protein
MMDDDVAQDTTERYSWSGATSHDLEKLRYKLVDGVGKDLREPDVRCERR